MPEYLVEGWTEPIDVTLLADGAPPVGSGKTIALVLRDRQGGAVDVTGKVAWILEASGTARFTPAQGDLKSAGSPYSASWKVTDASNGVVFFPNKAADVWTVRAQ